MSATRDPGSHPAPVIPHESADPAPPADPFHAICPFLVAADGSWRSVQPARAHRCSATQPAAELALHKQRELCLRASHAGCATYKAARGLELGSSAPERDEDGGLWPATTATVLALEAPRARIGALAGVRSRSAVQLLLVVVMVTAFAALVVARTTAPPGAPGSSAPAVVASADPGASAQVAAASPSVAPTAAPTATAASPSPAPSAAPTPAPSTTPAETYKVKRGDTLSSIAAAHDVTVKKLKKVNELTSNIIHVGDVLVIP